MQNSEFEDVLTLLALAVFADKKVLSSEIEAFMLTATKVPLTVNARETLSEARVLAWFENNKIKILSQLDLPRSEFDAWLIPILKRISDHSDRETLTHLMEMIAIADGDVHISESALIHLVKRNWDV